MRYDISADMQLSETTTTTVKRGLNKNFEFDYNH